MALINPRVYNWTIGEREPFVACETSRFQLRALRAGDRHAIPFPTRVLESDGYWRAERCRVVLLMEDGIHPRYPGVHYVMEITGEGFRERTAQWIRRQIQERVESYVPSAAPLGPVGNALVSQMADPSPLASESHWTERTPLVNLVSAAQVDEQRVQLQGLVWQAVVRYDWLPAMVP
jgi:hypothetical protein